MASQSIVDFIKESLTRNGTASPETPAPLDVASVMSLISNAAAKAAPTPTSAADELLYVTNASCIVSVLQTSLGMTARQIFDAAGADNFPAFQPIVAEMVRRGLLQISGRDPRYGDELYSLSSHANP